MSDVARVAAVSLGTVSNYLSGTRYVGPETSARVERAIVQLGYRPNRLARALVRDRTDSVGMVIPDVANPFFAEMIRGAEDSLGKSGFAAILGNSDNDAYKERDYLNSLRDRRVDGMILAIASDGTANEVSQVTDLVPTVILDRALPGWKGDSVIGDNRAGAVIAVRHLVELGHRDISMVGGDSHLSTQKERRAGFEQALAAEGLRPTSITEGSFTFDSGHDQAIVALSSDTRPTAVFAANDLLALGVIEAARELHVAVPGDLSVVGYDDIAYARHSVPTLTTVHQQAYEMGKAAADLLVDRLRGNRSKVKRIVMRPDLVVRRSTTARETQAMEHARGGRSEPSIETVKGAAEGGANGIGVRK